eukprot:scaffold748_cov251-Pinguiococcus_pyrenoidosus.AAC.40
MPSEAWTAGTPGRSRPAGSIERSNRPLMVGGAAGGERPEGAHAYYGGRRFSSHSARRVVQSLPTDLAAVAQRMSAAQFLWHKGFAARGNEGDVDGWQQQPLWLWNGIVEPPGETMVAMIGSSSVRGLGNGTGRNASLARNMSPTCS